MSPSGGNWKELFTAAHNGDQRLADYHLQQGIDPNYQHPEVLTTPLIEAAQEGHLAVVITLLEYGANPAIRSEMDGWTALEIAQKKGHREVAELLAKEMGVEVSPLEVSGTSFWQRWWKKLCG